MHSSDIYNNKYDLDFSTSVNPMGIPKEVLLAGKTGIERSVTYPDILCKELKQAISLKENISFENIICGNGAIDLIFSICLAMKPKKALLLAPSFSEYEKALRAVNCEIQYYYLKEGNNFHIKEDYFTYIEKVDIIILCQPNSPTSNLISKEFLLKVLEISKNNNVFMIVDECFIEFIENDENYSLKSEIYEFNNLFILKSFSKTYAMAGLRLGYGLCNNLLLLEKITDVIQPWGVSLPAQMSGIVATKELEYIKNTKLLIKREKAYIISELNKYVQKIYGSDANFIFFKSIPDLGERLKEEGILIKDCSNYVGLSKGYFRIAIKNRIDNKKLLKTIQRII